MDIGKPNHVIVSIGSEGKLPRLAHRLYSDSHDRNFASRIERNPKGGWCYEQELGHNTPFSLDRTSTWSIIKSENSPTIGVLQKPI